MRGKNERERERERISNRKSERNKEETVRDEQIGEKRKTRGTKTEQSRLND